MKYKIGDVVHVRARVEEVFGPNDEGVPTSIVVSTPCVLGAGNRNRMQILPESIVCVEPPRLKAGDVVTWKHHKGYGIMTWIIVSICQDEAWLRREDNLPGTKVYKLDDLALCVP